MPVVSRLTRRHIREAKPRDKVYDLLCRALPGFGVRVWPSGRRRFFYAYQLRNRSKRRVTIGEPSDELTVEQARRRADRLRLRVRDGEDPAAERDEAKRAPRLRDLLDGYLEHRVPQLKATTRRSERHLIEHHVRPRFGQRDAAALQPRHLEQLRLQMKETPGAFNKVKGVISRVYTWANGSGSFKPLSNPAQGVRKNKEQKRQLFLKPPERARLLAVLERAERLPAKAAGHVSRSACNAIRLLLLTGCRLGEILDLEWETVDLDRGIVRFKDSKTGPKTIILSPQAVDFFGRIRPSEGVEGRVCPGLDGGRLSNMQRVWGRVRVAAGIEAFRLHDLRHSFASDALMAGVPLQAVGALMAMKDPATPGRYSHQADEYIASMAARAGAGIEQREREGAKVVELEARRRKGA